MTAMVIGFWILDFRFWILKDLLHKLYLLLISKNIACILSCRFLTFLVRRHSQCQKLQFKGAIAQQSKQYTKFETR